MDEETLSNMEKRVLSALRDCTGEATPDEIMAISELEQVKVMNASSWLQSKGLVIIREEIQQDYTITEEGLKFLEERKDLADEVKSQMRHHWNPENIGAIGQMVGELGKLGKLMSHRLRHTDPDKMQRIREVVAHASKEIKTILEE